MGVRRLCQTGGMEQARNAVLYELAVYDPRVLTHERLLERVWRGRGGSLRPLRTMVSKLRRKLGDDADNPTYIFTEPQVGFRMPKGGTAAENPPAFQ